MVLTQYVLCEVVNAGQAWCSQSLFACWHAVVWLVRRIEAVVHCVCFRSACLWHVRILCVELCVHDRPLTDILSVVEHFVLGLHILAYELAFLARCVFVDAADVASWVNHCRWIWLLALVAKLVPAIGQGVVSLLIIKLFILAGLLWRWWRLRGRDYDRILVALIVWRRRTRDRALIWSILPPVVLHFYTLYARELLAHLLVEGRPCLDRRWRPLPFTSGCSVLLVGWLPQGWTWYFIQCWFYVLCIQNLLIVSTVYSWCDMI